MDITIENETKERIKHIIKGNIYPGKADKKRHPREKMGASFKGELPTAATK